MLCFFTIYNIILPYNIFYEKWCFTRFLGRSVEGAYTYALIIIPGGTLIKDQLRVGCCNPKLYPFSFGKGGGLDYLLPANL